ncbi:hypothetical protein ACTWPV_40290 [Nonomuraea sp. KM88]
MSEEWAPIEAVPPAAQPDSMIEAVVPATTVDGVASIGTSPAIRSRCAGADRAAWERC